VARKSVSTRSGFGYGPVEALLQLPTLCLRSVRPLRIFQPETYSNTVFALRRMLSFAAAHRRSIRRIALMGLTGALIGADSAATQQMPPPDTLLTLHRETDVASLIRFGTARDAERVRQRLIRYIWSGAGRVPARLPEHVQLDIEDPRFDDLPNLRNLHRLEIPMDSGIVSVVYHFIPFQAEDRLVLYHHGHGGGFEQANEIIGALLDSGFSVLALAMPLEGMNSRPTVTLTGIGRVHLTSHEHLKLLSSHRLNPLRFFVQPVIVALNYAERTRGYRSISMVGLSGGGWTTVLAAALDPRIQVSVPVAGSLPVFLRERRDWGDYEQTEPGLLAIANYPELYVLGTVGGARRRQVQVFNRFDPCCFAGLKHEMFESAVSEAVNRLGDGTFEAYADETHRHHVLSPHATQMLLTWLKP
jgi:dienelactone hydrolase